MIIGWERRWLSAAMVAGSVLMMSTGRAGAQSRIAQRDLPSFGVVGIAPASKFLRLNVTNVNVVGFAFLAPPGTLTVGPCGVRLTFSDEQGKSLKHLDTHLAVGQSASLDLRASDLPPLSAGRVEVVPAVQRMGGCIVTPSVEVVTTSTNETDAYVLRKDANGNGFLPAYGLVGMAPRTQFIRFNVSNQAISGLPQFGDCSVALTFSDPRGNPVKQSGQIRLILGTSTRLDLTASDLPPSSTDARRVEVLPSLAEKGTCALNSSVEVISISTDETNAYAGDAFLSTNR